VATICSATVFLGGIWAGKSFLISFALASKQAWWVFTIEIDVAEHSRCTVVAVIIDVIHKWACKFQESTAAFVSREFGPFALACDDCVVLELKVHRATCQT
jgi:hypothetical protein